MFKTVANLNKQRLAMDDTCTLQMVLKITKLRAHPSMIWVTNKKRKDTLKQKKDKYLNLIPAIVQPHWHSTDKWLDSCCALVIACSEPPLHILVIQHLNLKCEVFLHVFDNHDQER